MVAAYHMFRHYCDCLARRIIDYHHACQRTPGGNPIEHKTHRPLLVGLSLVHERRSPPHRDPLPQATPDMQLLQPVESLHALVVEALARLNSLQVDHSVAVATVAPCETNDLPPKSLDAAWIRLVPKRSRAPA